MIKDHLVDENKVEVNNSLGNFLITFFLYFYKYLTLTHIKYFSNFTTMFQLKSTMFQVNFTLIMHFRFPFFFKQKVIKYFF